MKKVADKDIQTSWFNTVFQIIKTPSRSWGNRSIEKRERLRTGTW